MSGKYITKFLTYNESRCFWMLAKATGESLNWTDEQTGFIVFLEKISYLACLFKSRLNCILHLNVHSAILSNAPLSATLEALLT